MIKFSLRLGMPAFVLLVGLNCAAVAQDKLRIAGGLAGTWENSFSELGQNAGLLQEARARAGDFLYPGRWRNPAGRDLRQRRYRHRGRHTRPLLQPSHRKISSL